MSALSVRHLQQAKVLTAISGRTYRLTECASSSHQHVWLGVSESDKGRVIVKSPLRNDDDEQRKAIRQLDHEMMLLTGPLRSTGGVRRLVDQIDLTEELIGVETLEGNVRAGVFEHLDFDLQTYHLSQKRRLSPLQVKSVARQVLKALSNTHERNIIHTDLKPENVVFSWLGNSTASDVLVKLIDFGVASQLEEDRYRRITNPYWRSPESWLGMRWGKPADIWSFGAIIGSLLLEPGARLFQPIGGLGSVPVGDREREFVRSIWTMIPFPETFLEKAPKHWQDEVSGFTPRLAPTGVPVTLSFIGEIFDVPGEAWAFIRDVLRVDADVRLTAEELLRHPWIKSS